MAASPFSLEKKVAIVTGGGVGIGRSIAIEFAKAGADVVICSRKKENLEPVVAEIKKLGRRSFCEAVDVRQEDAVKALIERTAKEMGRLDIMVNNAGASFRAKVEDISANGWNTVIQINVNGVFFGCKWAGKQMMAQGGGGAIINISSIAGVYGSTMMAHYGTAKAAVINFTRALGMAWGRQGIRVNCIAPGPIQTGMVPNLPEPLVGHIPVGRIGRAEEISAFVVLLASEIAGFVTGEIIDVNGGLWMD